MITTTLKYLALTQGVIFMRSPNGYHFNYWDQIMETQGQECTLPYLVSANEKGAVRLPSTLAGSKKKPDYNN